MSSPFDGIDWADYMSTFPTGDAPAKRKPDPAFPVAVRRAAMMLWLNEFKPTKSPKKLVELEKYSLLVKKFVQ
jgi:hypothetical protein